MAQAPFSYQLSEKDGLLSNAIFDLHISKEGFLFAGTSRGLMKYDGKKFEEIKTGSMKMQVSGFCELGNNDIYFLTFNGRIYCYQHDTLRLIKHLAYDNIRYPSMAKLSSEKIVFSASNGFYSYTSNARRPTYHTLPVIDTSGQNKKSVILGTLKNGVLMHCQGELFEIDLTLSKVQKVRISVSPGVVRSLRNTFLYKDQKYLFGKREGKVNLALYEILNNQLRFVKEFPQVLYSELQNISDKGEGLKILTKKGYYSLNSKLMLIEGMNLKDQSLSQFIHFGSANFYATTNNGIWVEPNTNMMSNEMLSDKPLQFLHNYKGTLFYSTSEGAFYSYFPQKAYPNMKLSKDSKIFADYSDNTFFLGSKGNYHLQLNNGIVRESKNLEVYAHISWVANLDLYLLSTSRQFGVATNKKSTKEWLRNSFEIIQESKINLFSTNGKLDYFVLYNKDVGEAFFNKKDSSIYVAAFEGVQHIKPNKKKFFVKYKKEAFIGVYLVPMKDKSILTIGVDGLYKIQEGKVTKVYSTKDGLIKNHPKRIKNKNDTLIIFYDKSIQIFTEKEKILQTFTSKTNLPEGEILDATLLQGNIYISTRGGLFVTPVANTKRSKAKAFVRYCEADEKRWPRNVAVPFDKNSLIFKINGLDLLNRGAFHYEYRLKGTSNPKWIEQDATFDQIRFYSLAEGDYSLELKVVPDFGPASDTVVYPFTIRPPFVRSWPFYLLCFLIALGIVGLIFYLRTRAIRRQAEFDKQVKQSEITAIKAQMNPHFVFNALNSIQSWVITKDVKNSNLYLGKFSKLVRKTLEVSEKNAIPLSEEIYIIQLYLDLENLRFSDEIKINFEILVPKDQHNEIYVPAMLIQPYIENVFKHGLLHKKGEKALDIVFKIENNKLICTIKDNGVGRKKAQEINQKKKRHQSFSTRANEKRVEILNEMFNNEIELRITDAYSDRDDCGTLIELYLPLLDFDSLNEITNLPNA